MTPLEIVALAGFGVVVMALFWVKEGRLADPTDATMIYVNQMATSHSLPSAPVFAALYRQSGNLYRDLGTFDGPDAAIAEIVKSFSRAGIESVAVLQNSSKEYRVIRLHHGHGGKAEGKKLGGARIVPVQ